MEIPDQTKAFKYLGQNSAIFCTSGCRFTIRPIYFEQSTFKLQNLVNLVQHRGKISIFQFGSQLLSVLVTIYKVLIDHTFVFSNSTSTVQQYSATKCSKKRFSKDITFIRQAPRCSKGLKQLNENSVFEHQIKYFQFSFI